MLMAKYNSYKSRVVASLISQTENVNISIPELKKAYPFKYYDQRTDEMWESPMLNYTCVPIKPVSKQCKGADATIFNKNKFTNCDMQRS